MKIIHLGYAVFLFKNNMCIAMYTDNDIMYIKKGNSAKKFKEKFYPFCVKTVDSLG